MTETLYDVLKISRDAPDAVIRASYTALMRQAHPDRGGDDPHLVRRLNEARTTLLDPSARAAYDESLRDASSDRPSEVVDEEEVAAWGVESDWQPEAPRRSHVGTDSGPPTQVPPPYVPASTWQVPASNRGRRPAFPRLWRGATVAERVTGWGWLLVSLIGPVSILFAPAHRVENLVLYGILIAASLHVAHARIVRQAISKRYVIWVVIALLVAVSTGQQQPLGYLYFGGWLVLFVAATELRRRRLWHAG